MDQLVVQWKILQQLKSDIPYYLFLPHKVINYFDVEHELQQCESFIPSNQQILQIFEVLFVLEYQFEQVKVKLSSHLLKSDTLLEKSKKSFPLVNLLQQWINYFRSFIRFIIESSLKHQDQTEIPRALRLAMKINCTEKETVALHYILISQSGVDFPALMDSNELPKISTIAKFAQMNSQECLNFFHEDSILLKQNLLLLDTEYRDTLSSSIIKMPKEVVNILIGSTFQTQIF